MGTNKSIKINKKCMFNILVGVSCLFSLTPNFYAITVDIISLLLTRLNVFTCAYPARCVVVTSNTPPLFERCGMLSCFVFRKQLNQNINYKLTVSCL